MKKITQFAAVLGACFLLSCNEPDRVTNTNNDYGSSTSSEPVERGGNTSAVDEEREKSWRMERAELREDLNERIDRFEAEIEELETKADMKKAEARADYKEDVAELRAKNEALKARLNDDNNNTNDDWQNFKEEFERDMDDLGNSIQNLGRDNKK